MVAFRATAFNDPQVVKLLRTHFVCVGIAHNGAGRRKDAEGVFARKIIGKGGTLQGLHVINTKGDLVGYVYDFRPQSVLAMLNKALKKFESVDAPPIDFKKKDQRFTMPQDGLVVVTITKVLGGHDPDGEPLPEHRHAAALAEPQTVSSQRFITWPGAEMIGAAPRSSEEAIAMSAEGGAQDAAMLGECFCIPLGAQFVQEPG